MTILKQYNIRGLNKRQTDINRDPSFASDLQNVELTSRRELVKRRGYDKLLSDSSIIDVVEYIAGNELIAIKSDGLYKVSSSGLTKIPFSGDGTTFTGLVDYDEYDGVLYITDTTLNNNMYKYDGIRAYRAGVPKVNVTNINGNGSGSTLYYRIYFAYRDNQNNYHLGDYFQTGNITTGGLPIFTIDTLLGTQFPHSNTDGDMVPVGVFIAASDNETFGYTFYEASGGGPFLLSVDHTGASYDVSTGGQSTSWSADNTPLEDFYDPTFIKGLPPLGKYVTVYGETMVIGNIKNDGTISGDTPNTILWSDTGIGSTVETFPPLNKQAVGKTSEGNITGLFGNTNEMTILKENQVYYLNGILVDRSYRLRSTLSAGIGCVSHKSVIETEAGCMFMSARGIYFCDGSSGPVEISDLIEPLFVEDTTGLKLSECRAARDTLREKLLFYIPATQQTDSIILVWDYYHKEWFLHKNIIADKGLLIFNNDLYHCDGSSVFKRSTGVKDCCDPIDARYWSGWYDLGSPSVRKKFINSVVISIGSDKWDANIKTQANWQELDLTDTTLSQVGGDNPSDDHKLNMSQYNSLRIGFENNKDEDILITGYEIEYQETQTKPKGDD